MKENKLNPKIKDIIAVRGGWTKGKSYLYLVTFSDPDSDWIGVYGIFPTKYSDPNIRIPAFELPNGKYFSGGYVNIFTGATAIHKDTVIEIIGTVSETMYSRICFNMLSVMLGNWEKTQEGYRVTDLDLNFKTPVFNIALNINNVNDGPLGKIDVSNNQSISTTGEEEDQSSVKVDPKDEKPPKQRTAKTKETSSRTINKIIDEYANITTVTKRIDFLFDNFAIDGYLPIVKAFNLLFNKQQTTVSARTLVFNRDQFFNLATGTEIVSPTVWRRFNGDEVYKPASALIKSMSVKASMLYNGYNR